MSTSPQIEFYPPENLEPLIDLIRQLYSDIPAPLLLQRLKKATCESSYRIVVARLENQIVGCLGYSKLSNLNYGDYYWVYDLVIEAQHRSKGFGKQMLEFLTTFGKKEQINHIALAANKAHLRAQQFYETQMRYEMRGFVYRTPESLT